MTIGIYSQIGCCWQRLLQKFQKLPIFFCLLLIVSCHRKNLILKGMLTIIHHLELLSTQIIMTPVVFLTAGYRKKFSTSNFFGTLSLLFGKGCQIYMLYMECMHACVAGCGNFSLNIQQNANIINSFAPNF